MGLSREIDYDYQFDTDPESGFPLIPENTFMEDDLYVLPNGKYLPAGGYAIGGGATMIYEPRQLDAFSDMLSDYKGE